MLRALRPARPTGPRRGLLVAAGLLLGLASCGESAPPYEGPYRHLLLISLDTTRADHLGCYGGTEARTPRLDQLAGEGVRFAQAMATAPTTLASHTSIMTGRYPRQHGVVRNGFDVHPDNRMLAEVLAERGFHTAGFAGSFALDRLFGFDQGFEHWDQTFSVEFDPEHADQNQRPADQVTDAVLEHVANFDGSERLFLFAHYFDVHAPYAPPEPYASSYMRRLQTSTLGQLGEQVVKHQERLTGERRPVYLQGLSKELVTRADGTSLDGDEDLSALYAGELAFVDREVGRLLDGLAERGILEECVVVLTADHGETFWEHGDFWHHGAWVYETNVHVPLLVRLPDGRGAGGVVQRPVSSIDLFPTVLELLEVPLPEPAPGLSLVSAMDGEEPPVRAIFSEATQPTQGLEDRFRWGNQLKTKAIRKGRWKLIQAPYLQYEELYDLAADPAERTNLLLQPTPEARQRYAALRAELDAWREVEDCLPSDFNARQMEGVMKRLAELGYTGELPAADDGR
jgi:arylsulfatase A-like enzyme